MLRTKFSRHALAFTLIVLASSLLYPAAQTGLQSAIWILLGIIIAASVLSIQTT